MNYGSPTILTDTFLHLSQETEPVLSIQKTLLGITDSKLKYNKFLFPELYISINHNNPSKPPTMNPSPMPLICVHPLINLVTASIVNNAETNKIIPNMNTTVRDKLNTKFPQLYSS